MASLEEVESKLSKQEKPRYYYNLAAQRMNTFAELKAKRNDRSRGEQFFPITFTAEMLANYETMKANNFQQIKASKRSEEDQEVKDMSDEQLLKLIELGGVSMEALNSDEGGFVTPK